MGIENPRQTAEKTERELLERSIVDSLIKLTRAREINWEFSDFGGATAEYDGITYFSHDEQSEGVYFIVKKRIEGAVDHLGLPKYEGIASFRATPNAIRLWHFLSDEVYPKDPAVIERQRRYEEREEQARKQAPERNAERLEKLLKEVSRQLQGER